MSMPMARSADETPATELARRLTGSFYQGYAYAYPHKTAYRPLTPPRQLSEIWSAEPKQALELYVHIPFCAMRCGFCNLFTTVNADADAAARLLDQIAHEAAAAARALGPAQFARIAIGGGTPSYLSTDELARLFAIIAERFGLTPQAVATSVEVSPETVTAEKLALLRSLGVDRISIGVQSFDDAEARALGRPQRRAVVETALAAITAAQFPVRNIDLIYGGRGQTPASWSATLDAALAWQPEEIFLYPLYVRPLTALSRGADTTPAVDIRRDLYRAGRDQLLAEGYQQINMRCFRKASSHPAHHDAATDGTLGLGCGARSMTSAMHYSSEYAVGRSGVRDILAAYLARRPDSFAQAHFGVVLSAEDQRRAHVLRALLEVSGVSRASYRLAFGTELDDDMPQLTLLLGAGLAENASGTLRLTPSGLERADVIGPWLYTAEVNLRMGSFGWR
ncbi:STM4012 family radical SAM protein [Bradyrhizobium sp. HKCCYLS2038]|uniref:STM4012 family radical SAM protein n=1 Tax=unclassified Bradyrhizobium TaxID=2631580 RepID=UPI003EB701CB